jgi:hypothetical protein
MLGRNLTNSHFYDLRRMVEEELALADPNRPDLGEPSTWLVDPGDAERTVTGLRSLLGAIQAVGDQPALVLRPPGESD